MSARRLNIPPLTQVYCGEKPLIDIVAVHGLNGGAFSTWTTSSGKFWLGDSDLLPSRISQARVLTFNYDAHVASVFGKTSSDHILQHAQTLVAELVADREYNNAYERPIVFICHSLGGIIVKRALAYSASRSSKLLEHLHSIYVSTFAIMFLGTPHNGSSKAALASIGQRMIKTFMPSKIVDTNANLLNALRDGSETLANITDMFTPMMRNFRIFFFWEQQKTDFGAKYDYIVDEASAAPILDNTERAGIASDHRGMGKFENSQASGYRVIVSSLSRYMREAPEVVSLRWIAEREQLKLQRQHEAAELLRFS